MYAVIRVDEITLTITVTNGTGSATFAAAGRIDQVSFKKTGNPTIDFAIEDRDGFPIDGANSVSIPSDGAVVEIGKLCKLTNKLTISNATDGDYSVRLWVEYGN